MSVRRKGNRWIVELYDERTKGKRQLNRRDIEALGYAQPANERQARRIERAALDARDRRRQGARDETCGEFAARWTTDFPRPEESTNRHNAERAQAFARDFAGRPLRSVTRTEARQWAAANPSRLPAVRAMFGDALEDRLVDENPFAKLGHRQSKGRADIVVLTQAEVDRLAELAVEVHGEEWGPEFAALILWQAYTCMRPGETYAARFSRLSGDTYDVGAQFNSRLRVETLPKHGSVGTIFVPEPARRAVLSKPRRIGDDLMFRTRRGTQFRQSSLHYVWNPVRCAFGRPTLALHELRHFGASYMLNELGLEPWVIAHQLRHQDGGVLAVQTYGHPSRRRALERMRDAYDTTRTVPLAPRARRGLREAK